MFSSKRGTSELIGNFRVGGMATRYSKFVPKLYNLCKELGFRPGKIMPSRAFCSDENQGYPIILIAKHFGTFPFNHGRVGGIVATDRNGPHAHHGEDLVIIHASHVGYDPDTKRYGHYRRLQTDGHEDTPTCGKACGVIGWYQGEYHFATHNILLRLEEGEPRVVIDNQLVSERREQGLFLNLELMVDREAPVRGLSTAKSYRAADALVERLGREAWSEGRGAEIGKRLAPELFYFRREIAGASEVEGRNHMETNLIPAMQYIITSDEPALMAAQVNTQVEFDRAFRVMSRDPSHQGKRVLFVSGVHLDLSPEPGSIFPLTKFVPWAAYFQDADGSRHIWEQGELAERLSAQSTENPDSIDLEEAIAVMEGLQEVVIS